MYARRNDWVFGAVLCGLVGCGGATPAASTPSDEPGAPTEASDAKTGEGEPETTAGPAEGATESTETATSGAEATPKSAPADPYADMPHPPDSDSGRPQLSADDVKETVKTYRPHLDTLCWTPRVNNTVNKPDTTRVAIEIEVTKKGEVKSIRAIGGKGYDGLASCVEEHVKRWHFPTAKQSSSLMFPILFQRGESTLIRVD